MEFKAQIMVKPTETGGGATTIIIDRTMIIAIVAETTTGGGTFPGITNAAESAKRRGNGPWRLADWHLLDRASIFSSRRRDEHLLCRFWVPLFSFPAGARDRKYTNHDMPHKTETSFGDGYFSILKKYGVEYDPRFVMD